MISRDWPSFLDELLTYKDIDIIQRRLKQERDEMPDPMLQALLPLMYMRRDQLVPEARGDAASSEYFEKIALTMHSCLAVVQAYLELPTRLYHLGEFLTREMVESNLPEPGETLTPEWRATLEEMLDESCADNSQRISEMGLHYVLSLPYRIYSVLMKVRNILTPELQFLFIQEALDAVPYRQDLPLAAGGLKSEGQGEPRQVAE